MIVLAVDTALAACSVAILQRDGASDRLTERTQPMARGHAEALMPMIDRLLSETDLALTRIDKFATTVGPGTFTGVRVGVAAIRGFALATGRPAVGISTLAALAETARMQELVGQDSFAVVIDARRGEVYAQSFSPDAHPLSGPLVAPAERVLADLPHSVSAAFGTGADVLAGAAHEAGRSLKVLGRDTAPCAASVARLGLAAEPGAPPAPLYLRPPDAKPQHAKSIRRR